MHGNVNVRHGQAHKSYSYYASCKQIQLVAQQMNVGNEAHLTCQNTK
jgi:hypothetical protein